MLGGGRSGFEPEDPKNARPFPTAHARTRTSQMISRPSLSLSLSLSLSVGEYACHMAGIGRRTLLELVLIVLDFLAVVGIESRTRQ